MHRILVTGGKGQLARCISDCEKDENIYFFRSHEEIDICKYEAVYDFVKENEIDIIINCAAYTNVDSCESNKQKASSINTSGPDTLAKVSNENNCFLIHISTDYVFDGETGNDYDENATEHPINVYGKTKLAGEEAIRYEFSSSKNKNYMIIRTQWLYSCYGKNFFKTMIDKTRESANKYQYFGEINDLNVVSDQYGSPTYAVDLAKFIKHIILTEKYKKVAEIDNHIFNFSNKGKCSWYDFAKLIEALDMWTIGNFREFIKPCKTTEYKYSVAKRPLNSVLSKKKTEEFFQYSIPNWMVSATKCYHKLLLDA